MCFWANPPLEFIEGSEGKFYNFGHILSETRMNYSLTNTHLASCNAHKAIYDVTEDSGIIRCDDINHIYFMRFKSFLTFANGSCENRQCEKRSPHTWPL
jgi:hypothetical protein